MKAEKLNEVKHWRNVLFFQKEINSGLARSWNVHGIHGTHLRLSSGKELIERGGPFPWKKKNLEGKGIFVVCYIQCRQITLIYYQWSQLITVQCFRFLNTSSELRPAKCREKPLVPFVAPLFLCGNHTAAAMFYKFFLFCQGCCFFFFYKDADLSGHSLLGWKWFPLELFKMDLHDLRLKIPAIQLLCIAAVLHLCNKAASH